MLASGRCEADATNLVYTAGAGQGTAYTCGEAQRAAHAMHSAFLDAYGATLHENASEAARRFPLLKLRPGEWEAPFVAIDAEGKEVESSPPAIEVPGSWRSSQEL